MVKPPSTWLNFWPEEPRRRFLAGLVAAILFISLALSITSLARQALDQMRALNTANSDNLQWTLTQTEVEYLQFHNSLVLAQATDTADFTALRRWFDIFYSRMNIIMKGPIYGNHDFQHSMAAEFGRITGFLKNTLPIIDGPNSALKTQLPKLLLQSGALRGDVREITLEGIRVFSDLADDQRLSISNTTARIALLTISLIVLLLLAVFFMMRIYRVTRRQAIENQATRERLQAMLNTSLDAVLVVDREGRFVEFNGAASEIFGYSEAEALGADMTQLIFAPHLVAAHNKGMRRHLETGAQKVIGGGRVQVQARRKSGEIFPVELSVAKTMSPTGEIFVSYLRDISERIKAENRLTKARDDALAGERAKARFLAVMSHEMRTPLNGLLGSLDLLKTTKLTAKQGEFADVMQKSGELLLHHVNDVLDIARLESGRMVGDHVALDLDALVQDVLESQSALAQAKGIDLRYRPETGKIGMVMGSAIGLRQVLLNLVNNAIKFTEKGVVEVQASVVETGGGPGSTGAAQRLSLRVRDSGIGIAPIDQSRVFDDFVTLDSSFGRRADGTGLGLGIARRIVQSLGGDIGVVSQPKLGATFWIDLPYEKPPAPAFAAAPAPQISAKSKAKSAAASALAPAPLPVKAAKGLDILIVEDNQINRFILREMLIASGHSVTEAVDGLAGVHMAQERRFDLIFMDISMPALDGIAATVRLRAGTGPCAQVPIVALTAHALPDDRALFLASGMNAVLNKPLDRAMLAHVLGELTEAPPPMRARKPRGVANLAAKAIAAQKPALRPKSTLPLLRKATLDDLKSALGQTRLSGLTNRFLAEGDALVLRSGAYLGAGQPSEAQALLHNLAGAAATFGALALQAHLAQMEGALKQGNVASAEGAHPALGDLWRDTKAELVRQMAA